MTNFIEHRAVSLLMVLMGEDEQHSSDQHWNDTKQDNMLVEFFVFSVKTREQLWEGDRADVTRPSVAHRSAKTTHPIRTKPVSTTCHQILSGSKFKVTVTGNAFDGVSFQ